MFRRKKKNKEIKAEPLGSFVPAHDDEPILKPSKAAKQKKNKKAKSKAKKSKQKDKKSSNKSKSKKKANKTTKKAKTETKPKSSKTKTKSKKKNKNKKDKKSSTNKNDKRKRAKTTVNKSNNKLKKKKSKRKTTETSSPKANDIQLNDISYTPAKKKDSKTPKKVTRFPWDNWKIGDEDDSKTDDESYGSHRTRRSSLGSVRELHMANVARAQKIQLSGKKGGGHRSHRKKSKKHKKHKHTMENDEKIDIYDPKAVKKKRRKEKEKQEFKVVPKHHVKRSSLPTYQSIRKNNPKLKFFVKKETNRNLATLLDQPEKRKKSKQLRNLSRAGFDIHVNKRYRLEDGRVGVCKYKGRTEFGKSSEDWIGLVLDIGEGEHDGSVQGKSYFRCRMGKGLFVRPYDIIQDMGSKNKMLSKDDIKLAKAHIKKYKKMKSSTTTSSDVIEKDEYGNAINPDHGYDMMQEKFYNPKTLLDKNKGKKAAKKKHHTQV